MHSQVAAVVSMERCNVVRLKSATLFMFSAGILVRKDWAKEAKIMVYPGEVCAARLFEIV